MDFIVNILDILLCYKVRVTAGNYLKLHKICHYKRCTHGTNDVVILLFAICFEIYSN